MVLVGESIQHLPLIIKAWQYAFSQGLGGEKSTLNLLNVWQANTNKMLIWSKRDPIIKSHSQLLTVQQENISAITLDISTPMRLQRKSKVVKPETINALDLLAPLLRRINMIEQSCNLPISHNNIRDLVEQARSIQSDTHLKWIDWKRYSQRQHQKITLGGVTGQWTITGELTPYSLALTLGQWLHIGKNTTFGMGRYSLKKIN